MKIPCELKKGDFIDTLKLYEIRGLIGSGGFGAVYLVYSLKTERHYAYKTLLPNLAQDHKILERFRKEANIWVDMGLHPNLVQVFGATMQMDRFYICMEYIEPDTKGLNSLDGYLRKGPIEFTQCLKWAIQFCYGMEYAYSKGIQCHRDIKPSNIMIDRMNVKVSDFGIARILDEKKDLRPFADENLSHNLNSAQTVVGTVFGTPLYMSPEQFVDATSCDQRSDIYSFGIVLYQMRSQGSLPFAPAAQADANRKEYWASIFKLHRDSPPPRINSRIWTVINRCLAKSPHDRYQTFQELRSDLEQCLKKETDECIPKPQSIKEDLNLKGRNLQALGRHVEAIECFNRELQFNPNNSAAWYNKGKSYQSLGEFEQAVNCFYQAAENIQYLSWGLEANAKLLTEMKRYEEAIACYEKMLCTKRPNTHVSESLTFSWLFSKGNILNVLGRYPKAINSYAAALSIDLEYVEAENVLLCWLNKAHTELKAGLHEDATTSFKKFLSLAEPNFTEKFLKNIVEAKRHIQLL